MPNIQAKLPKSVHKITIKYFQVKATMYNEILVRTDTSNKSSKQNQDDINRTRNRHNGHRCPFAQGKKVSIFIHILQANKSNLLNIWTTIYKESESSKTCIAANLSKINAGPHVTQSLLECEY